jgi:hypothetical protein
MSPYEYIILKQNVLRFFQGKNVKVSIFIQDDLQDNDGILKLPMKDMFGECSPPGVILPGSVIIYKTNGDPESEYNLKIETASIFEKNNSTERIKTQTTSLGDNLYNGERKSKLSKNDHETNTSAIDNKTKDSILDNSNRMFQLNPVDSIVSNNDNTVTESLMYAEDTEKRKANLEYLKKEFGNLADLLNIPVKNDQESDSFRIDLFSMNIQKGIIKNKNEVEVNYLEVERENNLNKIKSMFDEIKVDNNSKDDDDDLLDLMDMASK